MIIPIERVRPDNSAGTIPQKNNLLFPDLKSAHVQRRATFLVLEALERAGGNQTTAARLLGISQPALSKRLKMVKGA